MVAQQPAALAHLEVKRLPIADIVPVDQMRRQAVRERRLDRLRADEVAAMDDCLRARGLRLAHRLRERVRPVVAVRDDADLHAKDSSRCRGERPLRFSYARIECLNRLIGLTR